MADAVVKVSNDKTVVVVFGAELLSPLVAQAEAAAASAAADAVADVQASLNDEVTAAQTARTGAETAQSGAAGSAATATAQAAVATAAANGNSALFSLAGYDALNGSAVTIGDTSYNTSSAGTAHNFGGSAWTSLPMVVTSLAVRLDAAGTGYWVVKRRDGRILKKIAGTVTGAGVTTFSGFTPFYVAPGHSAYWQPLTGGSVRFAAGSGSYYDGNVAEGASAADTYNANSFAVSMSGVSFADTAARQAERLNTGIVTATTFGSTTADTADLSASFTAFSDPTSGPSIIDQASIRGVAAGGASTIIIAEPYGKPGSSAFKVIARIGVVLKPGVDTYDFPPVYAPKKGTVVGIAGNARFVTGGNGFLIATSGLSAVGSVGQRDYTTVPTLTVALSYRAHLVNAAPETPTYTDLKGPTPIVEQRFNTTTLPEWSLQSNVSASGSGLTSSGTTITAATSWAVFQRYSSANYKRMSGRFKVADATGAFALMMQPSSGGRGIAVVVDGTAGTLSAQILDSAGGFTSAVSVALSTALVVGHEYGLVCSYGSLNGTYTLTDLTTGAAIATITDTFGVANVHNRNWHGRPVVSLSKNNVCYSANFYIDRPRYIRTIIVGDSRSEGVTASTTNPSWAHTLADNNPEVLVSARAGDTTSNVMYNFAQDVEGFRPQFVVLALGANESSQATWRTNMAHLIRRVEAIGATPILTTVGPGASPLNSAVISAINTDILASYFGDYAFIDEAAAVSLNADRVTVDPAKYYSDNIHYIAAGVTAIVNMARARVPYAFRGF